MNIEEIYDLELKYQEVYKKTKDYTRNDFVIELIKKDDEKQELIDYLKERQLFYNKQYEYSTQQDDLKMYNRLINDYQKILNKIEKR